MLGVNNCVKSGRRALKIEKPKPLRLSHGDDLTLEAVLGEMEEVMATLGGAADPRPRSAAIVKLCASLKLYGAQLDTAYGDQLEKCTNWMRTTCRDDRLPLTARYQLLEIIELHAGGWKAKPHVTAFYQAKMEELAAKQASTEEELYPPLHLSAPAPPHPAPLHPAYAAQQQAAAALAAATHQLQYGGYNMLASLYAPPPYAPPLESYASPQPPVATTPVLCPGEVVRTSGKFTKPTRIAGKNYCKDEVVIRNQDSGKVMGIKGRRVHMIEELSETIISFQRVAPGARERLVQITGPSDENISQAKQLIEDTIRRNASPVRDCSSGGGSVFSCSLGGSHDSIVSDDDHATISSKRTSLVYPSDVEVGDYRYTVNHGSSALKITGASLTMVKTAKLLLDEWFNGDRNLNSIARVLESGSPPLLVKPATPPATPPLSTGSPTPSAEEPAREDSHKNHGVTVLRQPLLPCSNKEAPEGSSSGAQVRRASFAKTSETRPERIVYTRDQLVRLAGSVQSRATPHGWSKISKERPELVNKDAMGASDRVLSDGEARRGSDSSCGLAESSAL